MTKTTCDICGKEIPLEIYAKPIKDYKFCISSYGKAWDVCTECRYELNEWMKKRKTESESKCYAELAKSYVQGLRAGLADGEVK